MACRRGSANPTQTVRYRLFADSAGRCQNPDCLAPLFVDTLSIPVHFAEAAHIIAASDGGARTQTNLSRAERGARDNLILLCANCHTTIDKSENDFPVEMLRRWKCSHLKKIEEAFGIGQLNSRLEAFERLGRYRVQNREIFETYGPMSDHRFNPESESPTLWRKHVRETILPNNRAMLQLMDCNRNLMTQSEEIAVERFRIHVQDFEERHLHDPPRGGGQRFPPEVNHLFREVPDA